MNRPHDLTALSHCLADLSTLHFEDANNPRFTDWRLYTLRTLKELLGEHAPTFKEFEAIIFASPLPASREEQEHAWRAGRHAAYALLTTLRFQPFIHTSVSNESDTSETQS